MVDQYKIIFDPKNIFFSKFMSCSKMAKDTEKSIKIFQSIPSQVHSSQKSSKLTENDSKTEKGTK